MRPINFFEPYMIITINKPKTKNELKRMLLALKRCAEEDSNFMVYLNETSKQTIIAGNGEQHLHSIVDRLSSEFSFRYRCSKATSIIQGNHKESSKI